MSRSIWLIPLLVLVGFLPDARADNYWNSYLDCLAKQKTGAPGAPDCPLPPDAFSALLETVSPITRIPCRNEKGHYTGTGFLIDPVSCGPRPDCGLPAESCVPSGFEKRAPANALIYNCAPYTCCNPGVAMTEGKCGGRSQRYNSKTCNTCKEREDVVDRVAKGFGEAVATLSECFGSTAAGRGTQLKFLRGVLEISMKQRGIQVTCPNILHVPDAMAEYSSDTQEIALGPSTLMSAGTDEDPLSQTIAHELLHATGFDNTPLHRHSDPGRLVKMGNYEVEAARLDRIYACARLCFPEDNAAYAHFGSLKRLTSREECELCIGGSDPSCTPLITRAEIAEIDHFMSKEDTCLMSSSSFDERNAKTVADLDRALLEEELGPGVFLECNRTNGRRLLEILSRIQKRHPDDARNAKNIDRLRKFDAEIRAKEERKFACSLNKILERGQALCASSGESGCVERIASWKARYPDLGRWNSPEYLQESIKSINSTKWELNKVSPNVPDLRTLCGEWKP